LYRCYILLVLSLGRAVLTPFVFLFLISFISGFSTLFSNFLCFLAFSLIFTTDHILLDGWSAFCRFFHAPKTPTAIQNTAYMAAVNMQTMNFPLDFPHHHTRSASVSSSSTHSSLSRPTSSHGGILDGMGPDDVYRAASYGLQHHGAMQADHVRFDFSLLCSSSLVDHPVFLLPSLSQSPPTQAKAHLRPSHIRARAAASPYPRDTDSVHSSSSETEEMAMYINPQSHEYPAYGNGVINPSAHEPSHTAGAFGRMSLSSEQHLEKLAANVRAATTTSASDRAKQIFVQAW
jgi:regulatory factor X